MDAGPIRTPDSRGRWPVRSGHRLPVPTPPSRARLAAKDCHRHVWLLPQKSKFGKHETRNTCEKVQEAIQSKLLDALCFRHLGLLIFFRISDFEFRILEARPAFMCYIPAGAVLVCFLTAACRRPPVGRRLHLYHSHRRQETHRQAGRRRDKEGIRFGPAGIHRG